MGKKVEWREKWGMERKRTVSEGRPETGGRLDGKGNGRLSTELEEFEIK